jgi:hypothetical protein
MDAERITPEKFIEAVYSGVYIPAVSGSIKNIENPPGRGPSEKLLELHRWFAALDEDQKAMTEMAMADAADGAIFGLLCLLDNVRPVVDFFREELRLKVVSNGQERDLFSVGDFEELHGLFRSRVDYGPFDDPKY